MSSGVWRDITFSPAPAATRSHSQDGTGRGVAGKRAPFTQHPSAAGAHLLIRALTKRLSREPGVPRLCPMLAEDTWGQRTPSLTSGAPSGAGGSLSEK